MYIFTDKFEKMVGATISADIVSFTSLSDSDRIRITEDIEKLIKELSLKYKDSSFFGRVVQGDLIECAMNNPIHVLRIALILKTFIKSMDYIDQEVNSNRFKYFKEYGIRLAIAVGNLSFIDPDRGIIDGEAIYQSGRALKNYPSTSNRQRIVIKNTIQYYGKNELEEEKHNAIISLIDTIIARCSKRQSEVIYYKLLGFSEKEISDKLGKSQSTISQHSTSAGWQSIYRAVLYFEKSILI